MRTVLSAQMTLAVAILLAACSIHLAAAEPPRPDEHQVQVSPLRWLAEHQEPDGHWDSVKYGAESKNDVTVTSLALFSLLCAGHTEKVGEYKDNVRRAVAWLISQQGADGRIFAAADSRPRDEAVGPPEALAALALSVAGGTANVPATRDAAQKAIEYCTDVHQSGTGGFGYEPKGEPNIVATGWFIYALRNAKVAGLSVKHAAFDGAIEFLDSVEHKADGVPVYWYSPAEERPESAPLCTAIGAHSRQILGWKNEDLKASVEWFMRKGGLPKWAADGDLAYWYFATQVIFYYGHELWPTWNGALKPALTDNQIKDGAQAGSWPVAGRHAAELGRVGQTALGALCQEVYYAYLLLTPDK